MNYSKKDVVFFYAETPIHPGASSGWGAVDLPVQRESFSGLPVFNASGIKGAMRQHFEIQEKRTRNGRDEIADIFGPPTDKASDHAGSMAVTDAKLLLFPVRSLYGIFAYVTCPFVLQRFLRDLKIAEGGNELLEAAIAGLQVNQDEALVAKLPYEDIPATLLIVRPGAQKSAVFDEYLFKALEEDKVSKVVKYIRDNCFPGDPAYKIWQKGFPRRFAIIHDDVFRDFTRLGAEIITRNQIDDNTGTAVDKGLWTEEHLPSETILYSLVLCGDPPLKKKLTDAVAVLNFVKSGNSAYPILGLDRCRLQIGGDQTVGRGIAMLHFLTSAATKAGGGSQPGAQNTERKGASK